MHWKLSPEFAGLSELDIRAHDALIDRLLHVHLQRAHLLCLAPKEVIALRRAIQFGPQASRVLDTILRRSQDYSASLRAASRHLVLLPMNSPTRPPIGKEFYVRAEDASWWLEHEPALYVENALSDGGLYAFIISNSVRLLGGSRNYLMVRPFHGGGNPLGSVIEMLIGEKIQGICICDRDGTCAVPPFTAGSTSERAHEALHKLRVVNADGQSEPRNPFFNFLITHGWGVENYIGPNLLNYFFDNNPEASRSRSAFLHAFPQFPLLSDKEVCEWLSINFKSQKQDCTVLASGIQDRFKLIDLDEERSRALAVLSMPDSVIPFVISSAKAGRYRTGLIQAFDRDMKLERYEAAVLDVARLAFDSLAADSQMNFA